MKEKNSLSVWRVFKVAVILTAILVVTTGVRTRYEEEQNVSLKRYDGKYNEINNLSYLLSKYGNENVLISPFYINSSKALLYNTEGYYDNYFDENVNSYYISKMSKYKMENKEKTKRELYFDELINTFLEKGYDKINYGSLNKMGTYDKNDLVLLNKKILLLFNKSNKIKNIKNYKLSKKDNSITNKEILNDINNILYKYELYNNSNSVNMSNIIYTSKSYYKRNKDIINKYKYDYYNNINSINSNISNNSNIDYIVNSDIDSDNILVGNLLFNYNWDNIINKNSNSYEDFYIDEDNLTVEMMNFNNSNYLESNNAYGFIKDYEGSKYSFLGILPKYNDNIINISIEELIKNKKDINVDISIPKFSITYKDIYNKNKYSVIEKNKFNFLENGTWSSKYNFDDISSYVTLSNAERIMFNKPFYYLVIDNENNVVLLAGKVYNPLDN